MLLPSVDLTSSKESKEYCFFLAGFPDNQLSSWGEYVEKLSINPNFNKYKIICLCLPGYEVRN
jgi:hypothetical protein